MICELSTNLKLVNTFDRLFSCMKTGANFCFLFVCSLAYALCLNSELFSFTWRHNASDVSEGRTVSDSEQFK